MSLNLPLNLAHDLAIYGAGGFGREMALMVAQMNALKKEWNVIGFFDDHIDIGEIIEGVKVLGGLKHLNAWKTPLAVVVALADPHLRRTVVEKIRNEDVDFPAMIHPRSMSGSAGNKFGRGVIVTAGCILTTGITLGDFVIVNLSSTIGHDVKVGNYASVMPGCNISGGVTIGSGSLIGTGAQILQYIAVGNDCRVGAGAVVTKSVVDGKTVVGVPAREKEHRPKSE